MGTMKHRRGTVSQRRSACVSEHFATSEGASFNKFAQHPRSGVARTLLVPDYGPMTDEEHGPRGPVGHAPHDGNPQMSVSVDLEAAAPQGAGARVVAHVSMQDPNHPGIRASLQYLVPDEDRAIEPVGFSVTNLVAERPEGAARFGPGVIKDLPLARWDRVAQAAVIRAVIERRLAEDPVVILEAGPALQADEFDFGSEEIATPLHVPRSRRERAIEMVRRARPDLDPGESRGAARSWNGLVKLAEALDEYTELLATGSTDVVGEMAAAHGVAPATVRTWVHRARQAGIGATGRPEDASASLVPSYYRSTDGQMVLDPKESGPDPEDVARFGPASSTPSQPSIPRPQHRLTPREAAFKALGVRFLMTRERSRIRLVDARKKIGINSNVINKIDRGDFTATGGDAEIRGYLRVYSVALGLDPDEMLSQYSAAKILPDF